MQMSGDDDLPKTIQDIFTPCFLVDVDKVQRNAKNMIERCQALGIKLRPHMKTHKTIEAGDLLTGGTRRSIEVSTLNEAEFYAKSGYDDILYGCPIIEAKVERCKRLSEKLKEFHVMFDGPEGLNCLEKTPLEGGRKWSAYLEIDAGTGRTGVQWDSHEAVTLADSLIKCKNVTLKGIYTHDGHSYHSKGELDIKERSKITFGKLLKLAKRIEDATGSRPGICQGSTPSLSRPDAELCGLTECTPGNYVFYDYTQYRIGSCILDDVACRVATRVISHRPELNQFCIDCGFLGLSQDGFRLELPNGPCLFQDNPHLKLERVSQEIGQVVSTAGAIDFDQYPIGKMLFIYPNHSCATAAMYEEYFIHSVETITGKWKPTRCWKPVV